MARTAPKAPAPPDAPAVELVPMVRAQGRAAGYPLRCRVHPDEVAHMKAHDWVVAADADRSAKE